MKSLWLGKNKIEAITGLENLTALKQLDIQHNRLTTLGEGVRHLQQLEELYLAWNAIDSLQGLPDRLGCTFSACNAVIVVTSA
jgi:Leucine-rich repeat (LRR) protein